MKAFNLFQTKISGGFFADRQEINATETIKSVYLHFKETGRFDALKCEKNEKRPAHIFWDSDVAKWLESVAYLLARKEDKQIRAWFDEAVHDVITNQREDGYFNSHFMVYRPEAIFTIQGDHELYCAGHFFEAAVASSQYLGDDRLLKFSEKFVDYIFERFVVKQDTGFVTPGHEEIELALLRLYDYTKKEKYKTLAEFFIDKRGSVDNKYVNIQSHIPVRELREANGHAVRAAYLYRAMAHLAMLNDDQQLKTAVRAIFDDIYYKKMYITGGVGSTFVGEQFTSEYDLPNYFAYSETCAAIALVYYADKLFQMDAAPKYADVIERAIFNGVLSGVSIKGDSFFYVNPLESEASKIKFRDWYQNTQNWFTPFAPIDERVKVFNCSCCPPNVCRFMEQLGEFVFYEGENSLIVGQYFSANLESENYSAQLISDFPYSGKVCIKVDSKGKEIALKLRVPSWCDKKFENEENGFLIYRGVFTGEEITVDFGATLRLVYPNPAISDDAGKVCVSYGPLILCAEGVDNGNCLQNYAIKDLTNAKLEIKNGDPFVLNAYLPATFKEKMESLYSFIKPQVKEKTLTLIPYFAWANRGKNDMRVWITEQEF